MDSRTADWRVSVARTIPNPGIAVPGGGGAPAVLFLGKAAVVCTLMSLFGCERSNPSAFDFDSSAAMMRELTTPDGSRVLTVAPTTREHFHVESTWDIEASVTWKEYADAVKQRMPADYELKSMTNDRLQFLKSVSRDELMLELELVSPGPPLRIRARYRGSAG